MEITIRCPVHPTEDTERVKKAVETHLGDIPLGIVKHDQILEMTSTDTDRDRLSLVKQAIHEKRILAAVRTRLLKNFNDLEYTTSIHLDKQAAFVGKFRLIDNDDENPPLGSIEIHLLFTSVPLFREFLDWFCPRTKDGKVIS
ncbi:MAG: hypothetical protein C4K48_12095 [Candidatus Thorarchaeota archaeon]|nr:MAG: hypothetical protein C4K48_12095 [Candidatus Thorarchaeota archaeon]